MQTEVEGQPFCGRLVAGRPASLLYFREKLFQRDRPLVTQLQDVQISPQGKRTGFANQGHHPRQLKRKLLYWPQRKLVHLSSKLEVLQVELLKLQYLELAAQVDELALR